MAALSRTERPKLVLKNSTVSSPLKDHHQYTGDADGQERSMFLSSKLNH